MSLQIEIVNNREFCCTVVKGNGNGGCLLHYAHVLYDFIIPFFHETKLGNLHDCKVVYYPNFPLVSKWMEGLFNYLPLRRYGARGSCISGDRNLTRKYIILDSVDLVKTVTPPKLLTEFRDYAITRQNATCLNVAFSKSWINMVIIDRSGFNGTSFAAICRHFNNNMRRWLARNMPRSCLCVGGDIRGNIRHLSQLAEGFRLSSNNSSLSLTVNLVKLNNPSIFDTISIFCNSSIILGHHGAGLLNAIFAPKNSLVLEVPRGTTDTHSKMMPSLCISRELNHVLLNSSVDLNSTILASTNTTSTNRNASIVGVNNDALWKYPSLNATSIITFRLSRFHWYCQLFPQFCDS